MNFPSLGIKASFAGHEFGGLTCTPVLREGPGDRAQGMAASIHALRWRVHFNTRRPHCSPGYKPPASEAYKAANRLTLLMAGLT